MSTNVKLNRYRTFVRAATAWRAGYPHQAWVIITQAGLEAHWGQFQAEVLRQARQDFETAIERYYV